VTPHLDEWILWHFDPENVDATIAAMAAAQAPDDAATARDEAARKRILDCDSRQASTAPRSTPEPTRLWSPDGSERLSPSAWRLNVS